MSSIGLQVNVDGTDWHGRKFTVQQPLDETDDGQIRITISNDDAVMTEIVGTPEGVRAFALHLLDAVAHTGLRVLR